MIKYIRKRDGRMDQFNVNKIAGAIYKAFQATEARYNLDTAIELANDIEKKLEDRQAELPTVELIQDTVEETLIEKGYVRIAKAYILYRAERTRSRDRQSRLMQTLEEITFYGDEEYCDETPMTTMLKYGEEAAKQFNEMFVLNPLHAAAHKAGDIYIHDMDFLTLTTSSTQIDMIQLFKEGFVVGNSIFREPNSITSYSALTCLIIQALKNEQCGGQSIANFDYGMADGIRKSYCKWYYRNVHKALDLLTVLDSDEVLKELKSLHKKPSLDDNGYLKEERDVLKNKGIDEHMIERIQKYSLQESYEDTDRETYQAMESLLHHLNAMDLKVSIHYGMDTSVEGRMAIKNILLASQAGLGYGETSQSPIQVFRLKEGINYHSDDPNYDLFQLACHVAKKRLMPHFSFIDSPFNKQFYQGTPNSEVVYSGSCARVIENVYDTSQELTFKRGHLSMTSINLPRLAIKSKGDIDEFFDKLDQMIDMCVEQLLERFEIQCQRKAMNYPFLMGQGVWLDSQTLNPTDEVRHVLKHGTLAVGFMGLAETLKSLIGYHHGESEKAQILGLQIVAHMRKRLDTVSQKYHLNLTLIGTSSTKVSQYFHKLDQEQYGKMKGILDKDSYTPSFHVPMDSPRDTFERIKIEAPYHALTNGGHISYIEIDENICDVEDIVRAMHDAQMGYGAIRYIK